MPEPVRNHRLLARITAALIAALLFACQAPSSEKDAGKPGKAVGPYEESRGDGMGKN